jgi:hypothetical protein
MIRLLHPIQSKTPEFHIRVDVFRSLLECLGKSPFGRMAAFK